MSMQTPKMLGNNWEFSGGVSDKPNLWQFGYNEEK